MRMMKPWWLASALLLANVSAAQGPKALREEFRNPSLRYRMNVNRHSVPREERAQDSMIRWILDNGYRGMATNVNPDDYLRSDDELAVFNRFVHAAKKQGLDLWLYDERSYPSGMAHTYVLEGHPEWKPRACCSAIRPFGAERRSTSRPCRARECSYGRCL